MKYTVLKLAVVGGLVAGGLHLPSVSGQDRGPKSKQTTRPIIARIDVEAAHKQLDDTFFWFHPYAGVVPGAGTEGNPLVIALMQKHLVADDHYSETYSLITRDLGRTWSQPAEVARLGWMKRGVEHLAVSSPVSNWHAKTGKLLAIGSSNLHDSKGKFVYRPGSTWCYYAVYDPPSKMWSQWKPAGKPGDGLFAASSGCCQWLVEPDGDIMLPVYALAEKGKPWHVEVWRCRFDGTTLSPVSKSNRLVREKADGIHEPSLTRFGQMYYLTIRSNDSAFVSRSADGKTFEPIKPWTFDDGQPLGSYNTQQHWVTHSDGLFLAYTRKGADNDHIARHRAPVFLAEVDPDKLVVRRETEQIVFPERGVAMGNFGAAHVSANETWITTGENMWKYGDRPATYKGAEGAVLVGRIRWAKPNRLVTQE